MRLRSAMVKTEMVLIRSSWSHKWLTSEERFMLGMVRGGGSLLPPPPTSPPRHFSNSRFSDRIFNDDKWMRDGGGGGGVGGWGVGGGSTGVQCWWDLYEEVAPSERERREKYREASRSEFWKLSENRSLPRWSLYGVWLKGHTNYLHFGLEYV